MGMTEWSEPYYQEDWDYYYYYDCEGSRMPPPMKNADRGWSHVGIFPCGFTGVLLVYDDFWNNWNNEFIGSVSFRAWRVLGLL